MARAVILASGPAGIEAAQLQDMASEPNRVPLWIPNVLCLILCAGLVYDHWQSTRRADQSAAGMRQMSNLWQTASQKWEAQRLVNQSLEREMAGLAKSRANSASAGAWTRTGDGNGSAAVTVANQADRPDPKIEQLEVEREELTGNIANLTKSISDLQSQMTETQRRLDASEGDRETLLRRMKQLQAQKSKLEEQFHSLAALREQMHRLRDEQTVSHRLEWIRRGLYGQSKGSELLRKGLASAPPGSGNYNLDVEVRQSGDAKVLPPAN